MGAFLLVLYRVIRLILAPEWAQKPLQKFGVNKYGQPRYRVIWAPSATKIAVAGFGPEAHYSIRLKYGGDPKWMLEKWIPCDKSPEEWLELTATPDQFFGMGPYPSHGTYECCEKLSVAPGIQGYVPLEPGLIEMMARAVEAGKLNTIGTIRQGIEAEVTNEARDRDREFDDEWENYQHSHKGGLTIGAHAKYNHSEEVDDYVRRLQNSPRALSAARQFQKGFSQRSN